MKYFLDTEFIEGTQKGFIKNSKSTIDLISIGIVCEDGREYYAISKDFNLKEAWNRFQIGEDNNKIYWIREHVLKPIYEELVKKEAMVDVTAYNEFLFNYSSLESLIKYYGKTNKEIATELTLFCNPADEKIYSKAEFYGYYCDYDWIVFCWLFGHMIDLPQGFPCLCIDLEQRLRDICERKAESLHLYNVIGKNSKEQITISHLQDNLYKAIKNFPTYPKQENEHNALADAIWIYEFYKFLKSIK